MILFGTESTQLDIPVDQGLCQLAPPPPLELPSDCVVVDLPPDAVPVSAGDYLLAMWVELPATECVSKPSSLTFEYQPADCPGVNTQVGATCVGDLTGSVAMATLTAGEGTNNAAWVVTPGAVLPGEFVTFTAAGSKWPNDLPLTIDPDDAGDQELLIHTSCSQPLVLGDSFGSLVLTGISEDALGPSTRHSLYDLTIGAVGPEGPQGPQGKIGDTGDQGPQGKIGDTGDQGIQGKVGDTGDQGIQGKVGATGPQGIQGKVGPAGADGADGIGTNLLCFGTDQTIGSQGKFIGLGQQAGDHDTVGVISPFLARAEVVKLVVKVSQGNSPRDGDAQLFHDAVTAGGGQLGGNCALDSSPGDFRTVCSILINAAPLTLLDSLSVFVVTDSGSFEGASACVLIDPGP